MREKLIQCNSFRGVVFGGFLVEYTNTMFLSVMLFHSWTNLSVTFKASESDMENKTNLAGLWRCQISGVRATASIEVWRIIMELVWPVFDCFTRHIRLCTFFVWQSRWTDFQSRNLKRQNVELQKSWIIFYIKRV